jgi:hypothetical protein
MVSNENRREGRHDRDFDDEGRQQELIGREEFRLWHGQERA